MNAKRWTNRFFFYSFLLFGILGTINYTIDPFNIFHTSLLKHQFQMNERFMKIEYLEKNNKNFNSYMFGSSRIGTTPPSIVEKYIPNSKFYNMTLSSANLADYLLHLEYFIKKKYPIEVLYLQLDIEDMSYYGHVSSDYLRKPHPYLTNGSLATYYLSYLFGFFNFNIEGKIKKNLNASDKTVYLLESGEWYRPLKEKKILDDCQEYQKHVSSFNIKNKRILKYTQRKNNIIALTKIKKICNSSNIKLYVFTTPHNKNMMDKFQINDYIDYIKDLSTVTDFWDFSGYNSVTTNNCNYYEKSHYRPLVASLIAAHIFNDKSKKTPKDFGIFITKQNIKEHQENLREKLQEHKLILK